jgi:hypothetical protein
MGCVHNPKTIEKSGKCNLNDDSVQFSLVFRPQSYYFCTVPDKFGNLSGNGLLFGEPIEDFFFMAILHQAIFCHPPQYIFSKTLIQRQ